MNVRPSLLLPLLLLALLTTSPALSRAADCLTSGCHPQLDVQKNQHQPFADQDCAACHQPLPGAHPDKDVVNFELAAKGADLCWQCHDDAPARQPYLHGPVAVGQCTACHDPHRSAEKKLLKKPVRQLCLACHVDFLAIDQAKVSHPPVRKEACTTCHQPHGATVPDLLASEQPGVCIKCHDRIGSIMEKAKTRHPPLYNKNSCGGCHSSHYSDHAGLLAFDQQTLCLTCHGKGGSGSRKLRNIAADLEKKKFLHGPVQQGQCDACHAPHGSNSFRLLNGPYPASFYAPYKPGSYDLCLQCHEKDLLRFPETAIYTKFRNGKQNLHYLHVADPRKGRSCRACHEAHASDGEKLISLEGSKFGDWKIPVRFTSTPSGGSCAPGCHREVGYDRETPVDYTSGRQL